MQKSNEEKVVVLVLGDNEGERELYIRALRHAEVIAVATVPEALKKYEEYGDRIKIIFVDSDLKGGGYSEDFVVSICERFKGLLVAASYHEESNLALMMYGCTAKAPKKWKDAPRIFDQCLLSHVLV